jgi:hypothetical protein
MAINKDNVMKKRTRMFLVGLALLANTVVAIDILLYFLLSPEISITMISILVLLFIGLTMALFFIKVNRKVVILQWFFISLFCLSVVFLYYFSAQREMRLWFETKVKLDMIEKVFLLYHEKNNELPSNLEDASSYFVKGDKKSEDEASFSNKAFEDPFSEKVQFQYMVLDENTCIVYSRGLDRIDGKGMVLLNDDAIQYSKRVLPWSCMPFSKYILIGSGFDKKVNGDIVRRIEVK